MEIPDKVFFKIGEVSELAGVKPYVLRYWETEFSLVPRKSKSGQRLYRRKDIERILLIRRLLYSEGFTIAGARRYLSRLKREDIARLLQQEHLTIDKSEAVPPSKPSAGGDLKGVVSKRRGVRRGDGKAGGVSGKGDGEEGTRPADAVAASSEEGGRGPVGSPELSLLVLKELQALRAEIREARAYVQSQFIGA